MINRKSTALRQYTASIPSLMENWYIQKAKLKKHFPALTDNDIRYDEVNNGEIADKLRIKIGISKEELQKIISPA